MAVGAGYLKTSYAADMRIYDTRFRRFWLGALVVGLIALPWLLNRQLVDRLNLVGLAIIGAVAINLLIGYTGQVSLGQAAFLAIGAYTSAGVSLGLGLSMWVALPLAGLAAAAVGFVIGLPCLRLKGIYLALPTFALQFIVLFFAKQIEERAGKSEGFRIPANPSLGPFTFVSERDWYYLILFFAALTLIVSTNLLRSKAGRAWVAIRDRDIAAAIIGIDVARYKLLAFVISSFITGFVGSLTVYYNNGVVQHENYALAVAIQYVAMIIIGGMGSLLGSVYGAFFVTLVPFVIADVARDVPPWVPFADPLKRSIFDIQNIVFGVSIVFFLLVEPRGLVILWERLKNYVQLWPFKRKRVGA